MVFRRKTYKRRRRPARARRAKSTFRRRGTFRRGRGMSNTQGMRIKRRIQFSGNATDDAGLWPYGDFQLLTTTAETYVGAAYPFMLSDIPNYLEYANLFEQYKICAIKFYIQYYSATEYFAGALTTGDQALNGCEVMLWTDSDSSVAPDNTVAAWKNAFESGRANPIRYPNVKQYRQKLYFKPGVLTDVFQAGSTDQYARVNKSPWLKTGSPSIVHYGVKMMVNASPTHTPIEHRFRLFATYYIKFRYAKGETNT